MPFPGGLRGFLANKVNNKKAPEAEGAGVDGVKLKPGEGVPPKKKGFPPKKKGKVPAEAEGNPFGPSKEPMGSGRNK